MKYRFSLVRHAAYATLIHAGEKAPGYAMGWWWFEAVALRLALDKKPDRST